MTDTTTEAVTALLDGVTAGPWECDCENEELPYQEMPRVYSNPTKTALGATLIAEVGNLTLSQDEWEANARFIASARELVPALLAERDAAIARAEKAEDEADALAAHQCQFADGTGLVHDEDGGAHCLMKTRGDRLQAERDAMRAERDAAIRAALDMAAGEAQSEADAANKDADDARQRGFGEAASNIRQHAEAMESVMRAIRAITVADVLAKVGAK